jgi:ABC-type transport system involved in cytochrome c biogenesis permease subunit
MLQVPSKTEDVPGWNLPVGAGTALLILASLGYLAATLGFQWDLARRQAGHWRRWRQLLWSALALHTLGLVMLGLALGHAPLNGLAEATASLAWVVMLLYLAVGERWNVEVVGAVAAPAAAVMTAFALAAGEWRPSQASPNIWIAVHVVSVVLGYAAFSLAAFCAGLYFLQARLLKRKSPLGLLRLLPSLDTLDRVAYRLILSGFLPMVAGVVTGMQLMHGSESRWWTWDPKLTLVALTVLFYLVYLHARLVAGWQGRRVNLLLLLAFVCLLVSYLAPGQFHRF